MVKYIPELQQEVMGLIQKKEELLSRTTRQGDETHEEEQPAKSIARNTSIAIWASHLDDRQIVVQISSDSKVHKTPLSDILLNLEEDGLLVLNASSFESQGGRVFCNLHLQVCFCILGLPFTFSTSRKSVRCTEKLLKIKSKLILIPFTFFFFSSKYCTQD